MDYYILPQNSSIYYNIFYTSSVTSYFVVQHVHPIVNGSKIPRSIVHSSIYCGLVHFTSKYYHLADVTYSIL